MPQKSTARPAFFSDEKASGWGSLPPPLEQAKASHSTSGANGRSLWEDSESAPNFIAATTSASGANVAARVCADLLTRPGPPGHRGPTATRGPLHWGPRRTWPHAARSSRAQRASGYTRAAPLGAPEGLAALRPSPPGHRGPAATRGPLHWVPRRTWPRCGQILQGTEGQRLHAGRSIMPCSRPPAPP